MNNNNINNKEIFSKNLKYYMKKANVRQKDMADLLGVATSTFSDWTKAKNYPRIDKIERMANYFGIQKSDLIEDKSKIIDMPKSQGVWIPVLSRVAAGIPINMVTDIIDQEQITEEMAASGEYFALQIHGDSMEPRMKDGDVVIVRQQEDAESGEVVIATINGDDATCKRLRKYAEGIMLLSTNPAYEPMTFTNHDIEELPVKILGKVVELRAKF